MCAPAPPHGTTAITPFVGCAPKWIASRATEPLSAASISLTAGAVRFQYASTLPCLSASKRPIDRSGLEVTHAQVRHAINNDLRAILQHERAIAVHHLEGRQCVIVGLDITQVDKILRGEILPSAAWI